MVQNIKKYFKNFLLISGGILMASCNTKPIENEQFDYSKYPLYNENVDSIEYKFNDKEISDPFYKGNVVYNESVLLTKDDETGEISGNLIFKPTKILAVKDYTLKTKDYRQDVDFTLDGNKIIKKEGSDIPYRTHAELVGESIPEGYRLVTQISNQLTDLVNMGGAIYTESPFYYGSQLWVSYVYDVKEIDPYITSSSILIKIHPDEILDTLDAILKITGSEECIILLDENDTQSINALSDYIGTYDRIRIEFNYKEKNSITLKVETIYAIYEAIRYDVPFIQKIITLSGDGFKNPQNILIKNGTDAHELIESIGGYKRFNYKNMFLVSGDALKGKSMPNDNFIIGLESSGILAIKSFEDLEEKPCIRCGKCINICPQKLNPLMIIHSNNKKLNAQKCNECGLCSYICPSRIKIRDKIIKAKEYQNERIQRI